MPKTLRLFVAQLLAPILLVPIVQVPVAAHAQDTAQSAEAAQIVRDIERDAQRALKAEEKAREQEAKEAARLERQRENEARAAEKAAAKQAVADAKAAEQASEDAAKAAEEASEDAAKAAKKAAKDAGKDGAIADATSVTAAVPVIATPDQALPENILYLDLSTGGRVAIQLYPEIAPNHVERIKTLTQQGFYDGIIFHRVIEGFMAQTGDPTGTGTGGSDLPDVVAEFNKFPHLRGSLSMARAQDPNSANSQFFIVFYPRFSLDNSYTNFGRVLSGMEYVDAIPRGEPPVEPARILQASLKSQNKPEPNYAAAAQPSERAISVDDLNAPIRN